MTSLYITCKKFTSNVMVLVDEQQKEKQKTYANTNQKKAGKAMLVRDKVQIGAKRITRNKRKHYIMIKVSTHQEDKMILNMHVRNNRVSKYMKQKVRKLKGERDKATLIVGGFRIRLLGSSRQKISRDTEACMSNINQLDLTDLYRTFPPNNSSINTIFK